MKSSLSDTNFLKLCHSLDESMLALFNRKFKATVYNDGNVWWNTAGVIGTSCEFDMKYFPFDDQQCSVHFETCVTVCILN